MLLPEVHEVLHMLLPEVHEIEVLHMLLPLMCEDIFWRSSYLQSCLPLKVIFHWILFSNGGSLPLDVVNHWRSSSIGDCLHLKILYHILWSFKLKPAGPVSKI